MSSKLSAFLRQETGHQVGFPLHEQFDRLVGWDFFLENRLADSYAALISLFGHVGREERFLVFVDFDHRFRIVQNRGFADDHLVG